MARNKSLSAALADLELIGSGTQLKISTDTLKALLSLRGSGGLFNFRPQLSPLTERRLIRERSLIEGGRGVISNPKFPSNLESSFSHLSFLMILGPQESAIK